MTDRAKADEALQHMAERLREAETRMEKSVETLHKELSTIRTGRSRSSPEPSVTTSATPRARMPCRLSSTSSAPGSSTAG